MNEIVTSTEYDIRVVVLAEDPLARAGLAAMLSSQPGCEVVGQLTPNDVLLDALEVYQPQVIVWDLGPDPSATLEKMADVQDMDAAIVALIPDETSAPETWSNGLRSIIPRSVGPESLRAAVIASEQGLAAIDPAFLAPLFSIRGQSLGHRSHIELTPREHEVLGQLGEGMSNKSIAYALGISEHTVKFHVNSIMGKLGAQSRTEAVILATRMGLVPL